MASKIIVNLDTSIEFFLNSKCKQNDDLILECSIFENGLAKDLSNCSIVIQALKANKTYIIQNTDITKENNKFTANLVRDFTRVPGKTEIEIVLTESSKQNTTFSFSLEVIGSVIKGAVESGNTPTILEVLQKKIVEAGAVKEETEQLIEKGGAATKGEIQEVNAHLEHKANEVDLIVERERINNIIVVKDSVDNLETADIRIGANGKTYNSAGDAVRKQLEEKIDKTQFGLPFVFSERNYIKGSILSDGTTGTYSGWYISDFTECDKFKTLDVKNLAGYGSPRINFISFYDKDKTYISGIDIETIYGTVTVGTTGNLLNGEIPIPSNAFYYRDSRFNNGSVITDNIINGYLKDSEIIFSKKTIQDIKSSLIPLYSDFKIICVGDSLTRGDYGSEPSGTVNEKDECYPYFMAKYLNLKTRKYTNAIDNGEQIINLGYCGITPSGWYDKLINWGVWNNYFKYENNKKVIVPIMLGTNGGMTDTLEEDTSSGDYNTYATTETGYYCRIIEKINELSQGHAQIILFGCPFVDGTRRSSYLTNVNNANIVIPKIAKKYHLPFVDTFNELGISRLNTNLFQPTDGLHFGYKGYSRLGTFAGSKIKALTSFCYD